MPTAMNTRKENTHTCTPALNVPGYFICQKKGEKKYGNKEGNKNKKHKQRDTKKNANKVPGIYVCIVSVLVLIVFMFFFFFLKTWDIVAAIKWLIVLRLVRTKIKSRTNILNAAFTKN